MTFISKGTFALTGGMAWHDGYLTLVWAKQTVGITLFTKMLSWFPDALSTTLLPTDEEALELGKQLKSGFKQKESLSYLLYSHFKLNCTLKLNKSHSLERPTYWAKVFF